MMFWDSFKASGNNIDTFVHTGNIWGTRQTLQQTASPCQRRQCAIVPKGVGLEATWHWVSRGLFLKRAFLHWWKRQKTQKGLRKHQLFLFKSKLIVFCVSYCISVKDLHEGRAATIGGPSNATKHGPLDLSFSILDIPCLQMTVSSTWVSVREISREKLSNQRFLFGLFEA